MASDSPNLIELLNQIVDIRERRLRRARIANQGISDAVSGDIIDGLEIDVLQARVEVAKARVEVAKGMPKPTQQ
jgi:hypothetical protein